MIIALNKKRKQMPKAWHYCRNHHYLLKYIRSAMSIFIKSLSAVIKGILSQREVARIILSGSLMLYFWRILIVNSFISGVISITVHYEINCFIFRRSSGFRYRAPNNSNWVINDRKRFFSSRRGISVSSPFSR